MIFLSKIFLVAQIIFSNTFKASNKLVTVKQDVQQQSNYNNYIMPFYNLNLCGYVVYIISFMLRYR